MARLVRPRPALPPVRPAGDLVTTPAGGGPPAVGSRPRRLLERGGRPHRLEKSWNGKSLERENPWNGEWVERLAFQDFYKLGIFLSPVAFPNAFVPVLTFRKVLLKLGAVLQFLRLGQFLIDF